MRRQSAPRADSHPDLMCGVAVCARAGESGQALSHPDQELAVFDVGAPIGENRSVSRECSDEAPRQGRDRVGGAARRRLSRALISVP